MRRGARVAVVVDAVATDPLHVVARVDESTAPRPGDQVTVVTEALPPPGLTSIVTAVGPASGRTVPVTVGLSPRDNLTQAFVPGTPARVTLRTNAIGKTVTISADSLRPLPARVPGPSTVWLAGPGPGDAPLAGRAHPVPVTVTDIAQGRAVFGTESAETAIFVPGTTWPIVVPDHHCRTAGWPPFLWETREWSPQTDDSLPLASDQGRPVPPPLVVPESTPPVAGADEARQTWNRPLYELDVANPLDPDGGVSVVPAPPDRLDVTLGLRWRGARPVVGEDWVGPYYTRFWEGGDTRRSTVGCAPPAHACAARYAIALPPTTILRARTQGAPIDVRGLRREADLSTRSGNITLDGLGGYVTATSEFGDVVGAGIDADQITVRAGGRIDLRLTAPPRDLTVTGGRGPVTVEVPRGAAYDVETDAFPTGRRDLGIPSDPSADHHLTVRSDGGDVALRYAP